MSPTTPIRPPSPIEPKPKFITGLIILSFCLVAFLIQTEVTQYLQKNLDFKNPYFILWFSHSFYMLIYPLTLMYYLATNRSYNKFKTEINSEVDRLEQEQVDSGSTLFGYTYKLSHAVIMVSVSLTVGAYLWYVAVGLTSMSALTAIYNTSCFFAYLFSAYVGIESLHWLKSGSVALSIFGVMIVSLFTNTDPAAQILAPLPWLGNFSALISAVLIGLFEVLYKKLCVSRFDPTPLMSNYVTSYIGLVTFSLLWLPLPILHLTGIEPFALPSLPALGCLFANALMGVLYNAGLMAVISLTSPVFASVGVMVSIPLVSLVDSALSQTSLPWNVWLGGGIIFIAFLMLVKATQQESDHEVNQTEQGFSRLDTETQLE